MSLAQTAPGPRAAARSRSSAGRASPADPHGRFHEGGAVGFVEEEVLAWGEPEETLRRVLAQLAAGSDGEGPELISVLAGEDAPLGLAEVEPLGLQELARSGEAI